MDNIPSRPTERSGMGVAPSAAKAILPILWICTGILWLMAKPSLRSLAADPAVAAAQLAGLLGAVAIGWNLVLSSRPMTLDRLFGGLDKVFRHHRASGIAAFTLMLAHPLLLVVSALPSWPAAKFYLLPADHWPYNWGIFALWSFTVLIVLTLFVKLPYHVWRATHRFMGIPYVFVALHVATIESDVAFFMPLRVWILGIVGIGIGSYLYKLLLYPKFGPRFDYLVRGVRRIGDVTEVTLAPQRRRRMAFRAGQFVFVSFRDGEAGKEEHPFTISSGPSDEFLRLSIRTSGDHTTRIAERLRDDVKVRLHGPYGRFGEKFLADERDCVFIAGGIGVTPFLSMLRAMPAGDSRKKVTMFYATKSFEEAHYDEEISAVAGSRADLTLVRHYSEAEGFLTAEHIRQAVGDLKDKLIFLCGPPVMMKGLRDAFTAMGVPRRNVIFEDFSLR